MYIRRRNNLFILAAIMASMNGALSYGQGYDWTVVARHHAKIEPCTLRNLEDSTLYFDVYGKTCSISLDSVLVLTKHRKSYTATGATIGCLTGMYIGSKIGGHNGNSSNSRALPDFSGPAGDAVLGSLFGLGVGAAVGASLGGDEEFIIANHTTSEKIAIVRELINSNR